MELTRVPHGGQRYASVVALRELVLRLPLGLSYSLEELSNESDQSHFALFEQGHPIACLAVVRVDVTTCKIRQMAVHPSHQRRGLGHELLTGVIDTLRREGAKMIYLHARESAVPFYEQAGFSRGSETFEEVGIPHCKMAKYV